MNLIVSGIFERKGEKAAVVRFEEEGRVAEGTIPDCKIGKNQGFTEEEIKQLEQYMMGNLAMLKKQAAGVNPIKSMIHGE